MARPFEKAQPWDCEPSGMAAWPKPVRPAKPFGMAMLVLPEPPLMPTGMVAKGFWKSISRVPPRKDWFSWLAEMISVAVPLPLKPVMSRVMV